MREGFLTMYAHNYTYSFYLVFFPQKEHLLTWVSECPRSSGTIDFLTPPPLFCWSSIASQLSENLLQHPTCSRQLTSARIWLLKFFRYREL